MTITERVKEIRRDLHRNPELGGEEWETSKRIQAELEKAGIPFKTGFAKTGVLGIIEGSGSGGTVALRADIDALPITEKNECRIQIDSCRKNACVRARCAYIHAAWYRIQAARNEGSIAWTCPSCVPAE
nr:hypothetical protein [Planococcus glaciei]